MVIGTSSSLKRRLRLTLLSTAHRKPARRSKDARIAERELASAPAGVGGRHMSESNVRDDLEPTVTGAEARKSLEIILAIGESSRTGLPVKLPL